MARVNLGLIVGIIVWLYAIDREARDLRRQLDEIELRIQNIGPLVDELEGLIVGRSGRRAG